MAGAGNGEEFGEALQKAENNRFKHDRKDSFSIFTSMARKKFLLCFHDFSVWNCQKVVPVLEELKDLVGAPFSVLVIPDTEKASAEAVQEFREVLARLQSEGFELALHGYKHKAEFSQGRSYMGLIGMNLTHGEAEFAGLSEYESNRLLQAGLTAWSDLFDVRPVAFIPPTWYSNDHLRKQVRDLGMLFEDRFSLTTAKGKRTAFVYPICTTLGVILLTAAFYISNAIIHYPFLSMVMNPFSLATTNTIMRFALVILVLPFTKLIEKFVTAVFKDSEEEDDRSPSTRLEDRFIAHPALAIEQSRMTINDMAMSAQKAVEKAISLIRSYDEKTFKKVKKLEDQVDNYEDALGTYLIKLTGQEMTKSQNEAVSIFLHTVPEFESISDIAMNIAIKAKEMHDNKYQFSEAANHELDVMCEAVLEVVRMTNEAFVENDISLAKRVAPLEEYIDYMRDTIKQNHVTRLKNEICLLAQGIVFNDIITNCERVSDLCSNIAVAMIEIGDESFETHEYLNTVRERQGQKFEKRYDDYKERFPL